MDIALDDHEKTVSMRKITQARKKGNYFNASHWSHQESGKRGESGGVAEYFGSPSSDKRLVVYDKTAESNGVTLGNRWEARFRRKAAKQALYEWLNAHNGQAREVVEWCQNTVTGVIDFRDRSGDDPNRFRCERLNWFRTFIKRLGSSPARIRVAIAAVTIQKSVDWVVKSVAPTLALIRSVITTDFEAFLSLAMSEGGERLNLQKRRLAETTEKQQLCYGT